MRRYVLVALLTAQFAAAAPPVAAPAQTAPALPGTAPTSVASPPAETALAAAPLMGKSAPANALAKTAPAPAPVVREAAAVVPDNWAAPAKPEKAVVSRAIKQSLEDEKAIAMAESKEKAIPRRYTASSHPEDNQDKYEKFAEKFDDAKVPGCLQPDGLKRQPTFIFGGLLALPFIAVAAIRGKCN